MTRKWVLPILFSIFFLSSCALFQRPVEMVPWQPKIASLEGEGDLTLTSDRERFSGSFLVSLSYPDSLFFEVYGTFGQTLVHVERKEGAFLFIGGDEKTHDEEALSKRFGFTSRTLMDDLTLRGETMRDREQLILQRDGYRVVYSHDRRGRRTMCWERQDSRLCLTFDAMDFGEQ